MIALVATDILKILLAILVGGLIGAEREFRHRAAGFRTLIFICLGATLFTMLSIHPKQRASSTASSYGTEGRLVCFLLKTSQASLLVAWFRLSHDRHCSRRVKERLF